MVLRCFTFSYLPKYARFQEYFLKNAQPIYTKRVSFLPDYSLFSGFWKNMRIEKQQSTTVIFYLYILPHFKKLKNTIKILDYSTLTYKNDISLSLSLFISLVTIIGLNIVCFLLLFDF